MPTDFEPNDNQFEDQRDFTDARFSDEETPDALWELLSAYADGEASLEEAARVEVMLSADPAYARELDFLRLTAESARAFVEIEPPAALRACILASTSQRPSLASRAADRWNTLRRALLPDFARYAVPTGALAAAALAAFILWPRHHDPLRHTLTPIPDRIAANTEPSKSSELFHPTLSTKSHALKPVKTTIVKTKSAPNPKSTLLVEADNADNQDREDMSAFQTVMNDGFAHHPSGGPHPPVASLVNAQKIARVAKLKPKSSAPIDTPKTDEDPEKNLIAMNEPNMDAQFEHKVIKSALNTEPETVAPSASAGEPETPAPLPHPESSKRVMVGHLLRDQLPPDPRTIVTWGELKRQNDAKNQHYSEDAVRSIQRHEVGLSLISSRF